jgi:predicted Zn-dependent protease
MAADGKDYDFFNPTNDGHVQWLITDQKKYHLDVAALRIREGDYDRAIRELQFLLNGFPNHPEGLALMSIVARMTKRSFLAISSFDRALKLFPQYAITHAQYGHFLVGIGQVEAGIKKLQQSIEKDPKLAAAYVWLAKAYAQMGKQDLAQSAASQAKELGYTGETSADK